jgi:hypothetical protein
MRVLWTARNHGCTTGATHTTCSSMGLLTNLTSTIHACLLLPTAALLALHGALAEADAAKLRWQPGTDHCKWPGVYCTDDKYVYLIDLSRQGIAGTLSDAVDLSALQELQSIWLQGNQLAGSLPASWFSLPSLRELLLYDNAIEVCTELNIGVQQTCCRKYPLCITLQHGCTEKGTASRGWCSNRIHLTQQPVAADCRTSAPRRLHSIS